MHVWIKIGIGQINFFSRLISLKNKATNICSYINSSHPNLILAIYIYND